MGVLKEALSFLDASLGRRGINVCIQVAKSADFSAVQLFLSIWRELESTMTFSISKWDSIKIGFLRVADFEVRFSDLMQLQFKSQNSN